MNDHEALDKQLSRAWQALSPPAELEVRVRARLAASGLATTSKAGALPRASARAGAGWRALRSSGGVGVIVGAALLGLGFTAGRLLAPASPPHAQTAALAAPATVTEPTDAPAATRPGVTDVKSVAPAPAPLDVVSTPATVEPAPAPTPTGTARPPLETRPVASRANARAARAPRAGDAPNTELMLLERAERAVRARNADLALVLADQLEERYPSSQLHEERRAIELMALCQAGSSRALALGERFARRYPGSVYAERITDECGPAPTNRSGLDIDGSEGGKNAKPERP